MTTKTLPTDKVQKALQAGLDRSFYLRSPNRQQGEPGGKMYANGYQAAVLQIAYSLGLKLKV